MAGGGAVNDGDHLGDGDRRARSGAAQRDGHGAQRRDEHGPDGSTTDAEGRFRFANLPVGNYQVTVEAGGFAKYVRTGITLVLNQEAVVEVPMKLSSVEEVVTVTENASLLNTRNAEVSARFDSKRISELPLATNRNVFNVALSAAGVSQLGSGQTGFANGLSFSSNGGRVRSNNFHARRAGHQRPERVGGQQPLNNPDIVQEVRLVTNQFTAEYGRNSGSVINIVTKTGTTTTTARASGSTTATTLNSLSNLDKARRRSATSRGAVAHSSENQFGGTFGGPCAGSASGDLDGRGQDLLLRSLQRWTDRRLGSGFTLSGAPTEPAARSFSRPRATARRSPRCCVSSRRRRRPTGNRRASPSMGRTTPCRSAT